MAILEDGRGAAGETDALVDPFDGGCDGMSQSAISRTWRAFGLNPMSEAVKLSPDPQFVDKVPDIVGLYLNPPKAAVVLCVDEKAQIQALDRSAPVLPRPDPRQPRRLLPAD